MMAELLMKTLGKFFYLSYEPEGRTNLVNLCDEDALTH